MLEIFFSLIMILLPLSALLFKKFIPLFSLAVIGSNPYVTAGSLLLALLVRFQDIFQSKINKSLVLLCTLWLSYGLIIGITNFSMTFLSEYIQLIIAILLLVYLYHIINTEKRLLTILKFLMISGLLLSFFNIIIYFIGADVNTHAYIGSIANNYSAFYLVISTVAIPLFFMKNNILWVAVLFFGLFAIQIIESRAMMLLSILLIAREFISFNSMYIKIFMISVLLTVFSYVYITFDSSLIYDPNSIYSVLNFENNFSNLERLKLLIYSYDLFINNPFGHGLGSSYSLFFDNSVTVIKHYPHPHNTFAFLTVELGMVGSYIYIYFFYSIYKGIRKTHNIKIKKLNQNIGISLFAFSIVDSLFYNGLLMLTSFFLYAIILSTQRINFK